jgi:hypothetical protein
MTLTPVPPNTSLQRTVIDKVLARGPAVAAPRSRNHARLTPRTAAELSRYVAPSASCNDRSQVAVRRPERK